MSDLLQQLSGLVLGSVPTMLLFLLTLAAYRLLVHAPLTKVLQERYARTQGAMETASASIAAAEAKTAEYENRLRAVRVELVHHRQKRLHALHLESEKVLSEARQAADKQEVVALLSLEESLKKARFQMDASIHELASEVLRAVLSSGKASSQEQALAGSKRPRQ